MIGTGLEIGCRLSRPPVLTRWQAAPAAYAATTVYDFEAGLQSWVKSSTSGLVNLDLTVRDAGKTQSLKVQTQAAAATADAHVTGSIPTRTSPERSSGCGSPSIRWRGSATRGWRC